MDGGSIEQAILGFVRRVKDDPALSELFRAAANELHALLDPHAAEAEAAQQPEPPVPTPEPTEPAAGEPVPTSEPTPGG